MSLVLANSLSLPPEAALQRFGILAMSGAGKSNAAVVMAEEMFAGGIPWVAIDPKGDWWGIRSSGDGKKPGLAVPVFGGLEGDVPLEATGGKMVAELVAEERLTCVLDVSEFESKASQLRFLTDFATTLLRKNRSPLHIFAEEADEYLPQRVFKNEAPCVGAWSRLVKRGRFRGVFVTLITQRSAALSKDALSQVDTLIPMRIVHDRDKKAIREWVVQHDIGREMFDSLPSLDDGDAWVWSPQKLKLTERLHFRRRKTFDSGATPDWEARPPATLAEIDLDAVKTRMADTIEKQKAEDPGELRRRIRGLESELAKRPEVAPERTVEVPVDREVPVMPDFVAPRMVDLQGLARAAENQAASVMAAASELRAEVEGYRPPKTTKPERLAKTTGSQRSLAKPRRANFGALEDRLTGGNGAEALSTRISAPQQRILNALAWFDAIGTKAPRRAPLAAVAKTSSKSSGFEKNLSTLKTAGLIDYPERGRVVVTDEGFGRALKPEIPPTEEALHAAIYAMVSGPQATILQTLVGVYPDALTRDELASAAGQSARSSGFEKNLSTLRSFELIDYPQRGSVVALPVLFVERA